MGQKISTYHDVQSKGVDFLRDIYASSGLSIRPKATSTKSDMIKLLKDIIRSKGEDPSDYLKSQAEPHRIVAVGEQKEMAELRQDLIQFIRTEVMTDRNLKPNL